ncbi:MAG: response regulator [Xanthomonadales bacterium]|nr:response regulator [Xanthomonadales bacterium]
MKTAKEILDSLHPIERAIVLREFNRQKDALCDNCPHNGRANADPTKSTARPGIAEAADPGFQAAAAEAALSSPLKILWVDDDKIVHSIARNLLDTPDLDLHQAMSGYEALDLLARNKYDLLITDLGMPGMTGWQLTAKIKGKYPNMQIAILTGLSYDITPQVMEQHGILYCLRKPMTKDDAADLFEQVRANL